MGGHCCLKVKKIEKEFIDLEPLKNLSKKEP